MTMHYGMTPVMTRFRRGIQCRTFLGRVKSLCLGSNGNWSLHWSERWRCRVVRRKCLYRLPGLTFEVQGYLRNWCFHPRRWCTRTSNYNKEPDQASQRTNSLAIHLTGLCSIIFCEVVAIYGVVRHFPSLELPVVH